MGKAKGYLKGGSVKIFGLNNGIALIPAYRRHGKIVRGHVRSNPGWDQEGDVSLQERYRQMSDKNKAMVRQYRIDTRNALIKDRKKANNALFRGKTKPVFITKSQAARARLD